MKGASVLCQIKIGFQKLKSPLQGMQKTEKNQYIDWTAMDAAMWKTPWKMWKHRLFTEGFHFVKIFV